MGKIFEGLRPFQKAELLIMMLLAFAIPFSWLAAQYCEVALLVCAVLKVTFDQKFKMNERQMKLKWAYIIFAMTWVIYLIGMIYTENKSEGWAQVSKKLGFLIFPVIFMVSDMSYLTKNRLKAIGYSLIAGCVLFFLMNLCYAIYDVIFNGATMDRFFDQELMVLYYVHHSYLSMYAGLGLMFCFIEIFGENSRKVKIINVLLYITLVVFIILVRSRAGLIWMVLMFLLQWIWLTFVMKKKRIGWMVGSVFVLAIIGACVAFPQSVSRITETVKNITSEHSSDHRLVQYKGYSPIMKEHWLIGVGTGDRSDETMAAYYRYKDDIVEKISPEMAAIIDDVIDDTWYEPSNSMRKYVYGKAIEMGKDPELVTSYLVEYQFIRYAIDNEINAHNMFFEAMISLGIFAVLLLLAYFVIPCVLWIKTKRVDLLYLSFLLMIGFNMLFESIFETQKGIIFFCFFNALLFNWSFGQNEISQQARNVDPVISTEEKRNGEISS